MLAQVLHSRPRPSPPPLVVLAVPIASSLSLLRPTLRPPPVTPTMHCAPLDNSPRSSPDVCRMCKFKTRTGVIYPDLKISCDAMQALLGSPNLNAFGYYKVACAIGSIIHKI